MHVHYLERKQFAELMQLPSSSKRDEDFSTNNVKQQRVACNEYITQMNYFYVSFVLQNWTFNVEKFPEDANNDQTYT